jgi:hypothetical protein
LLNPNRRGARRLRPPAANAKFITEQRPDQWGFTKFKGTDVLGPDDANVGAVNDLLFDGTGKVIGMIVGVGGFLGIGAKNVATEMGAFDVIPASAAGDANTASGSAGDANNVKLKVAWTKDQFKDAPAFQYYRPPASATPGPATTGAALLSPASPRPRTQ